MHHKKIINQGDINLNEFIKILFSSKKIIFFITLVSILVSSINVLNNKNLYTSSVKVQIAEYDNKLVISAKKLSKVLPFLYEFISVTSYGDNFIKISADSASREKSIEKVEIVLDYILSNYTNKSNLKHTQDLVALDTISNKLKILESSMASINYELAKDQELDLIANLTNLKLVSQDLASEQISIQNRTKTLTKTTMVEPVSTSLIKARPLIFYVVLGGFSGLFLSVVFVYLLSIYREQYTE